VIVEVVTPSAVIDVGLAITVDCAAVTDPAIKVMVAVGVITRVSVVSVAVNTGVPAVIDVTVKVTTPLALDDPDAAEMVSVEFRLEARVTVFPDTGFEFTSMSVAVTVVVLVPLAVTLLGLALMVETV